MMVLQLASPTVYALRCIEVTFKAMNMSYNGYMSKQEGNKHIDKELFFKA